MTVVTNENKLIFEHEQSEHLDESIERKGREDGVDPLLNEVRFGEVPVC